MHGHISGLPELVVDTTAMLLIQDILLFNFSVTAQYATTLLYASCQSRCSPRLRPVRRFPLINTMFPCAGFLVS